jgi:hypothetical protein
VTEQLPEGGFLVEINGTVYRAVTVEELRRIKADREELQRTREERGLLRTRVTLQEQLTEKLKERLATVERERDVTRQAADDYRKLFENQQALLEEARKLVGKRPSGLTRFLSHPVTRIVLTALPPILARVGGR